MKIALVHDWLTGMRGGEKVLEVFCRLFPKADLFTLIHVPGAVSPVIEDREIRTSFLQHMPLSHTKYPYYLPLMPKAIERFDLQKYDLVLSTSHCVAKGVIPREDAIHISYCHTPMRYIWDQYDNYFGPGRAGPAARIAMKAARPFLRKWDVKSARRVTHFIANSCTVQKRIQVYYGKESAVIHPPVDTDYFTPGAPERPISKAFDPFFLIVSALVPYKRLDVAVEAFNRSGKNLVVIGRGDSVKALRRSAKSNIEFLGWLPDSRIRDYYRSCRALIFPGVEDFGIVPLEAMASGKPVIALKKGGATETVADQRTGLFFDEQSPEFLMEALERFEKTAWDSGTIREHALQFGKDRFTKELAAFLRAKVPSIDLKVPI